MNDYVVFENIKANLIGVYRKNNLLLGLQIKRYIKILALWPPGSSLYRDKNKKLIITSGIMNLNIVEDTASV